jgi:predicted Kef-type K+ transport protein
VLIGNPIIVMVIMGVMGYPKRVSFLAGLAVAQISEFSLILVALGFQLGQIENETVGLVTLVGLITIGLSTYMILYSQQIFDRISPVLSVFERSQPDDRRRARRRPSPPT